MIEGCARSLIWRTLFVRPAWAYSNGCKSPSRPYSGKVIVEGKGVRSDVESEGSRRQISGLTYRNMMPRPKSVGNAAQQVSAQ